MKIAVIGSGISGLSAAYYLSKKHKVDLFEKEDHFGGHSFTIEIEYEKIKSKKIAVDIGFIVFNELTYPHLINFFKENKIQIEKSNMSFSVSVKNSSIEYCGKGINGFFSNRSNLLNIKFIKMFMEILSFYKRSNNLKQIEKNKTLGKYLVEQKLSKYFIDYHIIPMVSAIWSMPAHKASELPLRFFIKFFQNHGLFKIRNRPQWYTVSNRSRAYVNKVLETISGEHYKNYPINKIQRNTSGIKIYYGKKNEFFDYEKAIIATHADQALKLIENPTVMEKKILSNFQYKKNIAVIHSDDNFMPKNKKAWSSWNSIIDNKNLEHSSVTYWLNLLQNLKIDKNIFLTLNPFLEIPENKIYKKVNFTHPSYDKNLLENQSQLRVIQNKDNILYCGSYFGNGFHEDGIKSSLEMIKFLND